ncbi:MAG: endopeptidase La [Proteobacteria bacterium]|nr:endopeptidase La [Pseudomonadota bacterium]
MDLFENRSIPVLATRNVVIFPGTTLPLNVGRAKSLAAIDTAQLGDGLIVAITQRSDDNADPSEGELYKIGTLCKIEKQRGSAEHGYQILVRGVRRVRITAHQSDKPYLAVTVEALDDVRDGDEKTIVALVTNIKSMAKDILGLIPGDTRQVAELIAGLDDAQLLTNLCAEYLEVPLATKQELLEMTSLKQRSLKLLELMQMQKEALQLQSEIREKLATKMGKHQREAILREQMRTIKEELGDDDGKASDDYADKVKASPMPESVKKTALDEAKRLADLGNSSPETHVIRNYLDLLLAMPWDTSTTDNLDLVQARQSLDTDHYGLEKIKKRIIQHLAVLKLKQDRKGSILLFVGPPGVGKTSLGQSIAKALGRKFARVSLGGVRDDAEIRGHRRTYVGAMPGRIVQALKRTGVNNPVFMLDEIDKLGRGYGGDPAAALLEVLDPEQNSAFGDHYLDVPFDLSKVFFIATANNLESIPGPLLDRMEVIDLSGYTTAEKLHIAKNHLIPKQLTEHGMKPEQLRLADDALMRLITHHTREAGVRDLERKLSEVMRYMTEKVIDADGLPLTVELSDLEEAVGPERYVHEVAERVVPAGVVTGLAWTPVGGEILFIEASLMPGSGKLTLTGQLGDVMKESAQIALSLVRSNLPSYVPGFDYDKKDIHIHVPAGAIPKDGPSAGVAMLTTLASLFTGRRVSPVLAMTGEITLRGSVMPVGGIKEKVMAAHRAGIERIILPKRNQKDLRDVPDEVKDKLKFEFAETAEEVLKFALDLDVVSPLTHLRAAAPAAAPNPAQ